ncbi:hypothetical protein [Streptomyces goshikiensis]|uniref:hypothetical protein n=1 Tax=Streptomyces goshikiensis TaxID=1942 RepID=UPI00364F0B07
MVLTKRLANLSEKAGAGLEDVRLVSSQELYRCARAVYVDAVQVAYHAEWVGRTWSQFPDVVVDDADLDDQPRLEDAPEVALARRLYEQQRTTFQSARKKLVAEFQSDMWGNA